MWKIAGHFYEQTDRKQTFWCLFMTDKEKEKKKKGNRGKFIPVIFTISLNFVHDTDISKWLKQF